MPVLVGILRHPTLGVILFDTGFGVARKAERALWWLLYGQLLRVHLSPLKNVLETAGVLIEEIAGVFISHFDPDHTGGLLELPDVPVYCSTAAWAEMRRFKSRNSIWRRNTGEALPPDLAARIHLFEAGPLGTETDLLGDGSLEAISLPGHQPGHMGLCFKEADGSEVLLCGDAVWTMKELRFKRWNSSLFVARNRRLAAASQVWLAEKAKKEPDLLIVPSHCADTMDLLIGGGWRSQVKSGRESVDVQRA